MSSPWPLELVERVGLDNIRKLRRIPRSLGNDYIQLWGLELSADETELVLSACLPDSAPEPLTRQKTASSYQKSLEVFRQRARFLAAAWLAGASWRQLGRMFEIQRTSAMASAGKYVPAERLGAKVSTEMPTLESLSAWRAWYYDNIELVDSMDVVAIAHKLLEIVDE